MNEAKRDYAYYCRDCEDYVEAVERRKCYGRYCPNGCDESCVLVPDVRPLEKRLTEQGEPSGDSGELKTVFPVHIWRPVHPDELPPCQTLVLAYHPHWGVREGWVNSRGHVSGNWAGQDWATHWKPMVRFP